jgi:hypothetical protein
VGGPRALIDAGARPGVSTPGRRRWRVLTLTALVVVGGLASYEFLAGFPRFSDGRWVRRVTIWHFYSFTPVPYQRGTIYHAYRGDDGTEVRHGPFRDLHGNGQVNHQGAYRHGQFHGTWTTWDHRGGKTNEDFWWNGQYRGWAIYEDGRVQYYNEQIYEAERLVASKRFEQGRWFLSVPVGVEARYRIDPVTGALQR